MNRSIAIFGCGGHGKVVGEIALLNKFKTIHFFDDAFKDKKKFDFLIKGNFADMVKKRKNYSSFFIAIGNNKIRSEKLKYLEKYKFNIINLIHPTSVVSKLAFTEKGICFMANSVINPGSRIGFGSIINTSASIDHDCTIGKFCHIAPNASLSGEVKIGDYSWIGTGASIKNNIKVGKYCVIGVGSKVYKNISDKIIYKN